MYCRKAGDLCDLSMVEGFTVAEKKIIHFFLRLIIMQQIMQSISLNQISLIMKVKSVSLVQSQRYVCINPIPLTYSTFFFFLMRASLFSTAGCLWMNCVLCLYCYIIFYMIVLFNNAFWWYSPFCSRNDLGKYSGYT